MVGYPSQENNNYPYLQEYPPARTSEIYSIYNLRLFILVTNDELNSTSKKKSTKHGCLSFARNQRSSFYLNEYRPENSSSPI